MSETAFSPAKPTAIASPDGGAKKAGSAHLVAAAMDACSECPSYLARRQSAKHANKHKQEHGCGCETGDCHSHDGEQGFAWTKRIIVPGALFTLGLLGGEWLIEHLGVYPFFAVMLAAYLLCGLPVLRGAAEAVARRDFFNEFTLMSFATIVAIGLGEMSEAVGVMLFYTLGEAAQERAAAGSRRSIQSLLASKPEKANLLVDGGIVAAAPEAVGIGSAILVMPGERVPLDGTVVSGSASLDLSSLTGESLPARVEKGDAVYSGSISLDGDLTIETTALYSDSMVGKILAMVESAVAAKSKTERFITAFARRYTPVVTGLAFLVATVPPLFFAQEWSVWIYRALVLLVVSCPCALFLSVPLAFFAGIGTASRHGMLVKGGQVFDALARARAVVFDKTGTLTLGRLSLAAAEPAPGVDAGELLRLAALAESRSAHPVAKAVLEAAGDAPVLHREVTTRNVAGKGVVAATGEGEVLVGNIRLMRDHGLDVPENPSSALAAYVALNGRYLGCLTFSDRVKSDSAEAIRRLREESGVKKLFMLTGDRPEAAEAVAGEMGLDGYRASLLPDGKVNAFREFSPEGDAVFVGDGVNDAPVLAAAGVGVAMGALGSAAAVEAADAVILDDSPARLPLLFRIAAKTRRIATGNIIFALSVKALVMLLGIAGVSGLWEAVFADVGVAFLAVLNSMRATRI